MSQIGDAKLQTASLDPVADSVPVGGTFWERGDYTFFNKPGGDVVDVGKYVCIPSKNTVSVNIKHSRYFNLTSHILSIHYNLW